jgi:predicted Rossmann fold nucleotide-binding protein DprA/Smf involved in DNA uptake
MSRRSDTSLAALLLAQRLVPTEAAPLKASEYWPLLDLVGDPARLLGLDRERLASAIGLAPDLAGRVAALLGVATAFAFALDESAQSGLQVLSSVDEPYPAAVRERLAGAAPPVLYAVGEVGLLRGPLLGLVGSGDVAAEARQAAAAAGWGVVSGDVQASGAGVLAGSLTRVAGQPDVRRAVTSGRLCLVTPYRPDAPATEASARGRTKLVYALSERTLVVTADAGAEEAVRGGFAPVLAWTGAGADPANAELVALGARAVDDLGRLCV